MNISWSFDFVTDFFEPVTTEGSKFHILPLLYFHSWVVNTFYLPEIQIEQTYCDCFKNIEKKFSRERKNSTKKNGFFWKKKKIGRKRNWQKKNLAKIGAKKKFVCKKYWLKKVLAKKNIDHATIHAPIKIETKIFVALCNQSSLDYQLR